VPRPHRLVHARPDACLVSCAFRNTPTILFPMMNHLYAFSQSKSQATNEVMQEQNPTSLFFFLNNLIGGGGKNRWVHPYALASTNKKRGREGVRVYVKGRSSGYQASKTLSLPPSLPPSLPSSSPSLHLTRPGDTSVRGQALVKFPPLSLVLSLLSLPYELHTCPVTR
jgi:hypothetical protein